MSQQEFSYFGPEQETVYEPHDVNRDPRELREEQAQQEQTVYYVTPEQSMLRGEKLIPVRRTKSHANWVAVTIFLLMMFIGALIWGVQVRSAYPPGYVQPPPMHYGGPNTWNKEHSGPGHHESPPSSGDDDGDQ